MPRQYNIFLNLDKTQMIGAMMRAEMADTNSSFINAKVKDLQKIVELFNLSEHNNKQKLKNIDTILKEINQLTGYEASSKAKHEAKYAHINLEQIYQKKIEIALKQFQSQKDLGQNWIESCKKHFENFKLFREIKIQKTLGIKSLNLSKFFTIQERNKMKSIFLSEESLQMLRKVKMPQLQQLQLQNNLIRDSGLKILCKNEFKNIQYIGLDDNMISLRGLNYILMNNWSEQVNYRLFSVISDKEEIYIKIENYLPIIKKIFKAKERIMDQIDKLQAINIYHLYHSLKLLLNIPEEQQLQQIRLNVQSDLIKKQFQKDIQNTPISLSTVLLELQKKIHVERFMFSKQSTMKTQISSRIIFKNMKDISSTYTETYEQGKDFYFSDFKNNQQKLREFQKWAIDTICSTYKIKPQQIYLEKLYKGSIKLKWSTPQKIIGHTDQDAYFNRLSLSDSDFDALGNRQFPAISKAELLNRGGLPYYKPVLGVRYGINVSNVYNDVGKEGQWLKMNGNKDEWSVVFHGVNYPLKPSQYSNGKQPIVSILSGRESGQMLKKGLGQGCQGQLCLNQIPHNNTLVGPGIYCSPHFTICLNGYCNLNVTDPNDKYHLILQCRAKPRQIKIPINAPHVWVVNESRDIRPYGIILITKQQKIQIDKTNPIAIYKEQFDAPTWNAKYKQQYENFIS